MPRCTLPGTLRALASCAAARPGPLRTRPDPRLWVSIAKVLEAPDDLSGLPHPGARLIGRVAGGDDVAAFHRSGRDSVAELRRTLAIVGARLESFDTALDFGCGCGRMMIWLAEVARHVELHGTDIDAEAIAWCQEALPYATFGVNGAEPPTRYRDGQFDLVFNHSVFTHIDARLQDLWLTELQRITRPGALLVLSVHGETAIPDGAWEIRDRVEASGIAYLDESFPTRHGLPDWYQNTWHAPWYVFAHWQQWFKLRAYIPGAALGLQDHVLLERVDGPLRRPLSAAHTPAAAAAAAASERVSAALASLKRYQEPQPRPADPLGMTRHLLRGLLLRVLKPYTVHQHQFNAAVAASITQLAAEPPGENPSPPRA